MDEYYKRQHRPTPKLKMPFFGGNDSESEPKRSSGNQNQDINPTHLMYLIGFIILVVVGLEVYKFSKGDGSITSKSSYYNVSFKGVIKKKYIAYDNPSITRIDVLEKGKIVTLDLSKDQSGLFNYLNPKDSIYKIKENMEVIVNRYGTKKSFSLKLD